MLEIYEVFDASNEELVAELQKLQQLLRTAQGAQHVEFTMLYETVVQELEERGMNHKVLQQLTPLVQQPVAPPAAPQFQSATPPPAALSSWASGTTLPSVEPPRLPTSAAPHVAQPPPPPVQPVTTAQRAPMLYSFGSIGPGHSSSTAHIASSGQVLYSISQPVASTSHAAPAPSSVVPPAAAAAPTLSGSAHLPAPPARALSVAGAPRVGLPVSTALAAAPVATNTLHRKPDLPPLQPTPDPPTPLASPQPPHAQLPQPQASQPQPTPHASAQQLQQDSQTPPPQTLQHALHHQSRLSGPSSSGDGGAGRVESNARGSADGDSDSVEGPDGGSQVSPGPQASPGVEGSIASVGTATAQSPGKEKKLLSPWEASMLAFQEEQRKLRKARQAIKKSPAKPAPRKPAAVQAPALGAEASSGSAAGRAASKPPRPSGCGGAGSGGSGGAHTAAGSGTRQAAGMSPHGAAALAAGTAVAAKASGAGAASPTASPTKAATPNVTASAVAQNRGAGSGPTAGMPSGPKATSSSVVPNGVSAPAAGAGAGGPAEAGAPATTAAGSAAAKAVAGGDEAATVADEEPGLDGPGEGQDSARPRPSSAPESVKTDEDSRGLVAEEMRSSAAAIAAASQTAGAAGADDSEPESVSSDATSSERCSPGRGATGPRHTAPAGLPGCRPAGTPNSASVGGGSGGAASGNGAHLRVLSAPLSGPSSSASAAAADKASSRRQLHGSNEGQDGRSLPGHAWAEAGAVNGGQLKQPGQRQDATEARTVLTESSSDSDYNSDDQLSSGVELSKGARLNGLGGASQRGKGFATAAEMEEARRREIAAAALAAIHGRSAADASSAPTGAHLARAVVNAAPMRVDRWADWELADSTDSLSAWATNQEDDPMRQRHLRPGRPMGPHAPPESLAPGPTGAHGLAHTPQFPQTVQPQLPSQLQASRLAAVASKAGRPNSAVSIEAADKAGHGSPLRQSAGPGPGGGAAPGPDTARRSEQHIGSGRQGSDGRGGSGGGTSSGSDADRDDCRTRSLGRGASPSAVPQGLPRSGMVPAGAAASALATSAATTPTASPPAANGRRPPLAPSPPRQPPPAHSARGAQSGSLSRGPSSGSLHAAHGPTTVATDPGATGINTAYLQHYSAFHDVLSLCYNPLTALNDAASLASSPAAAAAVAGNGSTGSRPPSRLAAASAVLSGADLLERYTSLLARCEAWQAKLRQMTESSSAATPLPSAAHSASRGQGGGSAPSQPAAPASATARCSHPSSPASPTACSGSLHKHMAGLDAPDSSSPLTSGLPRPTSSTAVETAGLHSHSSARPAHARPSSGGDAADAATAPSYRYVAVMDDTAHPEVREVITAAVQLLAQHGWAMDPADQVTEVSRPESSPDDPGDPGTGGAGGAASALNSRPGTAALSANNNTGGGTGRTSGGSSGGTAAGSCAPGGGSGVASSGGPRCHVWNVLWSWSVRCRVPWNELLVWQRVNHFSEARQLTRKDLLKKHLARYQAMHNTGRSAALFDRLTPTTFVLPKEAAAFEEAYVRALHGVESTCVQPVGLNLWIQKPVGLSRGRGISLIGSTRQVNTGEPMVVQRYLTDPLLVEGYKFDLRLYVLVTSFNPLEAWLYEEGFARFTTLPYTLDEGELGNMHVHLTNSSVQKSRAEVGLMPDFLKHADPPGGSKASLASLRALLDRQGVAWGTLWGRVAELVTAALFAAQDAIPHCPNSFELFGFDVMVDSDLKVWLLEVNSSPSMGLDTPLDRAIKPRLIADALALLGPLPYDRGALAGVLRSRTSSGRGSRRGVPGLLSGTASEERELCCADLQTVLGGTMPRRYGEKPRTVGGFKTQLAPSAFHDKLLKLRRPLP